MNADTQLAYAIGFMLTILLYGVNSCLYFESLSLFYCRNRRPTRSFKIINALNDLLFICATLYTGITMSQLAKAFVTNPGGPGAFFVLPAAHRHWENLASLILTFVMMSVFNILMVYRCYLIWLGNIRSVLVQILFETTIIALSITTFISYSSPQIVPPSILRQIVEVTGPLQLAQNILNTGLIVFRLLRQHRDSAQVGLQILGTSLAKTARIVTESAMIYTSLLFCLTILTVVGNVYAYTLQLIIPPIIGIVLNLIVVRGSLSQPSPIADTPSKIIFPDLLPTSSSTK